MVEKDRLSPQLLRLIDSINQKARAAQVSAAGFYFIGLLLLAFAFSTADLDLIRNTAEPLGALNVPIPVIGGFALAPLVFVAMHGFTLIRYDMLGQDLETYREEIDRVAGDDADLRDWYRHLIANIEFVQVIVLQTTVPPRTGPGPHARRRQRDRLLYLTAWLGMVLIPLVTLAAIEISALRLQSPVITWTQKGAIVVDVVLLLWFLVRILGRVRPPRLRTDPLATAPPARRAWIRALRSPPALALHRLIDQAQPHDATVRATPWSDRSFLEKLVADPRLFWRAASRAAMILIIPALVFWYGTIPGAAPEGAPGAAATNSVLLGRSWRDNPVQAKPLTWGRTAVFLRHLVRQPLDLVLCPETHWGCRYLTIGHRTLDAAGSAPLDLSERNLRYADFRNVSGTGLDFWGSDLADSTFEFATLGHADFDRATLDRARFRHAHLTGASLRGARLIHADLAMAVFKQAQMQKADLAYASLFETELQGANLADATLAGTMAFNARLQAADLAGADATFAFLAGADLAGATLDNADLAGAYMLGVRLWGADLRGARLVAADLRDASLFAADLSGAGLEGALLANTDLRLADLGGARFYGAETDRETSLSYADAGGADMITPLAVGPGRAIAADFAAIHTYADFKSLVGARLHRAETPPARHRTFVFTAAPGSIHVEAWPEPRFPSLPAACVMRTGKPPAAAHPTTAHTDADYDGDCDRNLATPRPAAEAPLAPSGLDRYDRTLATALVTGRLAPTDAAASEAPASEAPGSEVDRLEFRFALARRALAEGSSDDRGRNARFACAAHRLLRPALLAGIGAPHVDIIGNALKSDQAPLASLCRTALIPATRPATTARPKTASTEQG